jgi:hypothetical protein
LSWNIAGLLVRTGQRVLITVSEGKDAEQVDIVMQVQLEQCTFQNNTEGMPNLLADNSGYYSTAATIPEFYSDDTTLQVCVLEQDDYSTIGAECNRTEPVKGLDTVSTPFLSRSDPIFVSFQQVGFRLDFKRFIYCFCFCPAFLWCMHSFPDQYQWVSQ